MHHFLQDPAGFTSRSFDGFSSCAARCRELTPETKGTSIPVAPPIAVAARPSLSSRGVSAFQTGFSLYAKRAPRPFPKPWINPPTSSFSEPLSVHSTSMSRRPLYPHQHQLYNPLSPASSSPLDPAAASAATGRFLRGYTNGDDALLMHARYLAVADGVGSWNLREKGYPALWSRLLVHYFSIGCERFFNRSRRKKKATDPDAVSPASDDDVDIKGVLNDAYNAVIKATGTRSAVHDTVTGDRTRAPDVLPMSESQRYQGTSTFTGCILNGNRLHVVNIGDSHCLVLRPSHVPPPGSDEDPSFLLRTVEQWHYFDCPRQLGTDSPDTPLGNAVVSSVEVENGDIVILATDGLLDNLWEEEVVSIILRTIHMATDEWDTGEIGKMMQKQGKRLEEGVNVAFREYLAGVDIGDEDDGGEMMTSIAAELVKAAKVVATDPYAESPWMERAVEEGKSAQGGKLDDISVVIGRVVGISDVT
ncbi:hypothetical protein ABW21_db0208486 [Orbilia brochopaga]|nr:hypothetical protein ABW21_db0208486 [Drechslerella brochopaga]